MHKRLQVFIPLEQWILLNNAQIEDVGLAKLLGVLRIVCFDSDLSSRFSPLLIITIELQLVELFFPFLEELHSFLHCLFLLLVHVVPVNNLPILVDDASLFEQSQVLLLLGHCLLELLSEDLLVSGGVSLTVQNNTDSDYASHLLLSHDPMQQPPRLVDVTEGRKLSLVLA